MAVILYIETTGKNCSVNIANEHEMLCLCEEFTEDLKHSEKLHQFVLWALEGAKIQLSEVQAVCVSQGPGSYTGLRIGVSAAKGFCYALDILLLAVNTLHVLAKPHFYRNYDLVFSALDARRDEIFCQEFSNEGNPISEVKNTIVTNDFFNSYSGKKVAFVGDGSRKLQTLFSELQLTESFHFHPDEFPSSKNMIELGLKKFHDKNIENLAYFEPFYLKPVHITSKKV